MPMRTRVPRLRGMPILSHPSGTSTPILANLVDRLGGGQQARSLSQQVYQPMGADRTDRSQMTQQLGQRNIQSLLSDPRLSANDPYAGMDAADIAGSAIAQGRVMRNSTMTGPYSPLQSGGSRSLVPGGPPLTENQAMAQRAYANGPPPPGGAGFVSEGPLTDNSSIREGGLPRTSTIMGGTPTTRDESGNVVAADPEQQASLDLRSRRQREVRENRQRRREEGLRRLAARRGGVGAVPGGSLAGEDDGLTESQRGVVQGAFAPVAGPDGQPVPQPPAESLRSMYLSEEFQGNPPAAAAALRHQMTQQEFIEAVNDMRGGFFGGGASPELIAWLEEVGQAWGVPTSLDEQGRVNRAAGSYVPGIY